MCSTVKTGSLPRSTDEITYTKKNLALISSRYFSIAFIAVIDSAPLNSLELPLDIGSQTLVQLLWNGEGYLRRQQGYMVEYLNFAVFNKGVDVIRSMQVLKMSTDIEKIFAEMGSYGVLRLGG